MANLSQIGFYVFSGAMGAVGVAAVSGVLDTPPRGVSSTPAALVSTAQPGAKTDAKSSAKEKDKQVAALNNSANDGGPEKKASAPKEILPTFDILRVEKDGSTLIAGNAAPGSTVEIVIGGKVVATTTAGGNGDFVAILDQPLKPGDHQISIRSTGKDNKVLVSLETGLVSVPKNKDGELLAMVSKPGEASRILQATAKTEPEKTEVASAEKAEAKKDEPAKTPTKAKDEEKVVAGEKSEPVTDKVEKANTETKVAALQENGDKPAEQPAKTVSEPAKADVKSGAKTDKVSSPALPNKVVEPAKKAASEIARAKSEQSNDIAATVLPKEVARTADKTSSEIAKIVAGPEKDALKKTETVAAVKVDNKTTEAKAVAKTIPESKSDVKKAGDVKTAALPSKAADIAPPPVKKAPVIVVEAVEVEGGRLFIAGAAEPGRRIAIYLDNVHVGFATGTRNGRFLLEVDRELASGFHVVRADIFDAGGMKVAARAEVPLVHEPESDKQIASNTQQPKKEPVQAAEKNVVVTKSSKGGSPEQKDKPATEPSAVEKPAKTEKPVKIAKVVEAAKEPKKPAELPKVAKSPKPVVTAKVEPVIPAAKEQPAKKVEPEAKVAKIETTPTVKVKPKVEATPKAKAEPKIETAEVKKPEQIAPVAEKLAEKVANPDKATAAKIDKPVEKKPVIKAETPKEPVKTTKEPEVVVVIEPKDEPAKVVTAPVAKKEVAPAKKTKVASLESGGSAPQKILRTGSSVIIRKGDSLWRISYRTYGRGIRYSTIYQANLRQVKNPHKIYPGQILKVPKRKTDSGS